MRAIDADEFERTMYHEAFENDASYDERNPMAKWESGLWIRYKMFENCLEKVPTIEPKQGEWRTEYKYKLHARPTCTVCGYDGEDEKYGRISNRIVERFNFCPNCGADMRKGANNE